MVNVNETLAQRGTRYGNFQDHAAITQGLKEAMRSAPRWAGLRPDMKEALEMVAHKIGRILNGDPAYADSWHDIAGYVTLVEQTLGEAPTVPFSPAGMDPSPVPVPPATGAGSGPALYGPAKSAPAASSPSEGSTPTASRPEAPRLPDIFKRQ